MLTEKIIETISALRYELAKGDTMTEKSCGEFSQPLRLALDASCDDLHITPDELTVSGNLYQDGTLSMAVVYSPRNENDRKSLTALFRHYRCIDARRAIDEKKEELKRLENEIAEMEHRKAEMVKELDAETINDD